MTNRESEAPLRRRQKRGRAMKITAGLLLAGFVLLQFFRPQRVEVPVSDAALDILSVHPASAQVSATLRNACYDCHSDTARYPWYAQVQPVAWQLERHIAEGRAALNFSRFGRYSEARQVEKMETLVDELTARTMPLKSYQWLHRDARLSPDQIQLLLAWADEFVDEHQ